MIFPVVMYVCHVCHVCMWELDYKESWALKNWCFWTVVLEKTLESPLNCKEIQPVHPKGNQPWIFIGRTDVEVETPILWPPDVKNWLIWKDLDAGKDWRQEKGMIDNEMVGWHHWLDGHEFEQALGVGEGQGRLECCRPWSHKESDMTEWLNYYAKGFSSMKLVGLVVKNLPANAGRCKRCGFDPWVGKIPWRRTWQPTPEFLPRESRGQRSLVGYGP